MSLPFVVSRRAMKLLFDDASSSNTFKIVFFLALETESQVVISSFSYGFKWFNIDRRFSVSSSLWRIDIFRWHFASTSIGPLLQQCTHFSFSVCVWLSIEIEVGVFSDILLIGFLGWLPNCKRCHLGTLERSFSQWRSIHFEAFDTSHKVQRLCPLLSTYLMFYNSLNR